MKVHYDIAVKICILNVFIPLLRKPKNVHYLVYADRQKKRSASVSLPPFFFDYQPYYNNYFTIINGHLRRKSYHDAEIFSLELEKAYCP